MRSMTQAGGKAAQGGAFAWNGPLMKVIPLKGSALGTFELTATALHAAAPKVTALKSFALKCSALKATLAAAMLAVPLAAQAQLPADLGERLAR
ncbi:hypothetical protein, partial [Achromobacter sp. AGC39]